MRVLIIKTSSMGDIIHTLPALTDAGKAHPNIRFDWLVEDLFAEIPSWHPFVAEVIPVALRRWRKGLFLKSTWKEWQRLRKQLKERQYDLILDAQGLVKSAFLMPFAQGIRAGLNWTSAREPLASLAYQKKYNVQFKQHAVTRMRSLFSQALNYPLPKDEPDFGLGHFRPPENNPANYFVFLHGTTWKTKQWPERYWLELANLVTQAGYQVKLGGGNEEEIARAQRIAKNNPAVEFVSCQTISGMAHLLLNAKGAISVDTGFGHLSAALNVPTISLYGSTTPIFTGAIGKKSTHLTVNFPCAPCLNRQCKYPANTQQEMTPPCFATLTPPKVWQSIQHILSYSR